MSDAYEIGEMQRAMANLIRVGKIVGLDESNARVKVSVGGLTTDWLPWAVSRAGGNRTWSAPEIGEQVVVLSPHGDPAQGIVLPSIYQDDHPAPADSKDVDRIRYADGTVTEYDRAEHRLLWDLGPTKITADRTSLVLECNGTKLTLSAAGFNLQGAVTQTGGATNLTGNMAVTGNITATGTITDGDGDGGA